MDLTWKGRLVGGGVGYKESYAVMDMSRHMGGHSWLPMWLVRSVGVVLFTRVALPPLWVAGQVRNDGGGAGSRVGYVV